MSKAQPRRAYRKGDIVRDVYTGKVYTVKQNAYWQPYAGGDTADYTVPLESIDPSQPTPWNKSTNLEPVITWEDRVQFVLNNPDWRQKFDDSGVVQASWFVDEHREAIDKELTP